MTVLSVVQSNLAARHGPFSIYLKLLKIVLPYLSKRSNTFLGDASA